MCRTRSDKSISKNGGNNKDLEAIKSLFKPTDVYDKEEQIVEKIPIKKIIKTEHFIEDNLNPDSSKKLNETFEMNQSGRTDVRTLKGGRRDTE